TAMRKPTTRLRQMYVVALTLIALFSITSQGIMQSTLSDQEFDGTVINISGRQRMLSQNITKNALLLRYADSERVFKAYKQSFKSIYTEWVTAHQALQQGDLLLNIPSNYNSSTVETLFTEIRPSYQQIKAAGEHILDADYKDRELLEGSVNQILGYESTFLRLMNSITFQYEAESKQKLDSSKSIEFLFFVLILVVLVLEVFFVFRPAIQKVEDYTEIIQEQKLNLEDHIRRLKAAKEELKQYNEELYDKNDYIATRNKELYKLYNKLETDKNLINTQNEELRSALETVNKQRSDMNRLAKELSSTLNIIAGHKLKSDHVHKKLQASINYALRIQQAMLPLENDIKKVFPEHFIFFKPRDVVSGDFYWFTDMRETSNRVVLAVAYCTGHGVTGAFMIMMGNGLLQKIVQGKGITDPDKILEGLHYDIRDILKQKRGTNADGMDISILTWDQETNELLFAGAKSHFGYAREGGHFNVIKGNPRSIGGYQREQRRSFELHRIAIDERPMSCYLSTDGFQDQFGGNTENKKYSSKRLRSFIDDMIQKHPVNEHGKLLDQEFTQWKGKEDQIDDVLVMGFKVGVEKPTSLV
ncbi:MAG: type IV pili methyl-accepting chemotaxis transducer N-terminal domain-containing protein, partial [Bacteroidota bacterium]